MSMARTQADRHWIQLEAKPDKESTGFFHIDLNMVDEVQFVRCPAADDPEFIGYAKITYAGTLKPLGLEGKNANWFYEKWTSFIALAENDIAPKAEKGLLYLPPGAQGLLKH